MKIEYNGKMYNTKKELAEEYGISYSAFCRAIRKEGIDHAIQRVASKQHKEQTEVKNEIDLAEVLLGAEITIVEELETEDKNIILTGDMLDLYSTITKYAPKSINLIDFENINGVEILSKYVHNRNFNIFFYNACLYSNKFYRLMKHANSINFQVLVYNAKDQLIDKVLLFYLGQLKAVFPNIEFNIISGDTGFVNFLDNCKVKNVSIDRNVIDAVAEKNCLKSICNFLLKSKYVHNKNRKYTINDLKTILKEFKTQKHKPMSEEDFEYLFHLLLENDCIKEVENIKYPAYIFSVHRLNEVIRD